MAKVSVITRTKNRPVLLERVWTQSLSIQTYSDIEWVIVNDGGDAAPVNKIAEVAKGHIHVKVLHNEKSLGMEAASNFGIGESNGDYIHIHDDDDTVDPSFYEKTVEYLENHEDECGVFTHIMQIREEMRGRQIVTKKRKKYTAGVSGIYLIDFLGYNPFVPIAFLYRRSLHEDVGMYDDSLPVVGDWDFFIRALRRFDAGFIHEYLAHYHIRINASDANANSIVSKSSLHQQRDSQIRNRILREDLDAGRFGLGMLMNLMYQKSKSMGILYRLDKLMGFPARLYRLFR